MVVDLVLGGSVRSLSRFADGATAAGVWCSIAMNWETRLEKGKAAENSCCRRRGSLSCCAARFLTAIHFGVVTAQQIDQRVLHPCHETGGLVHGRQLDIPTQCSAIVRQSVG